MKVLKIVSVLIATTVFSMQICAQSCMDLFKTARSLQEKGKYAEAIIYYEKAKVCDSFLASDCDKHIKECQLIGKDLLVLSQKEVLIPYQGSDSKIAIKAKKEWFIENDSEWCVVEQFNNDEVVVQCRKPNNSTREKINYFTVKSGELFQTVKVIQAGRPEYIDVGATFLSFPANGTEQTITIESNARWDVTSVPSWCEVEKTDTLIHIHVSPNDQVIDRTEDIVVYTPSERVIIKIYQGASNENLTLSQSELNMPSEGDVRYVRVYTDADNWYIGDFPNWVNVQRVADSDSIRIECGPNDPVGEIRSGSVQVKTDRQNTGIMIHQSARMPQYLIFPESKIVSGRDFSIGVSASCSLPFVGRSSGGNYVGSVVDYSLGTVDENSYYKTSVGYNVGLFADWRLYKNLFLQVGVGYAHVSYENHFNQTTTVISSFTSSSYLKGEVQNKYTESYSLSLLEVPILASYRFKIGPVSHFQIDLGPVLNIGLSAHMNLSGNSDSETMKMFNKFTHEQMENTNYVRHTGINTDFNLYQPCVLWNEIYSTGNDVEVSHHDTFKSAPLNRINCGLRIGAAYEVAGLSLGIYYTAMLTNMADKGYWEGPRWAVLNESNTVMSGYSQRLNTLEFKLAYNFLRYLK